MQQTKNNAKMLYYNFGDFLLWKLCLIIV